MTKKRIRDPKDGSYLTKTATGVVWEPSDVTPGGRHVFEIEDATGAVPPVPPPPTGAIYSNFLRHTDNHMTLNLPAYPEAFQRQMIAKIVAEGYRDLDLYCYNAHDNPFREERWVIKHPEMTRRTAQLAKAAGLRTTIWIFSDELPAEMRDYHNATRYMDRAVAATFDVADRYIVALEGNESFRSDTTLRALYEDLWHYTGGAPIYVHLTPGKNFGVSYANWKVTGLYYQFTGRTRDAVRKEAIAQRQKWRDAGKLFVAGEFNREVWGTGLGAAVDDLVDGRANG